MSEQGWRRRRTERDTNIQVDEGEQRWRYYRLPLYCSGDGTKDHGNGTLSPSSFPIWGLVAYDSQAQAGIILTFTAWSVIGSESSTISVFAVL